MFWGWKWKWWKRMMMVIWRAPQEWSIHAMVIVEVPLPVRYLIRIKAIVMSSLPFVLPSWSLRSSLTSPISFTDRGRVVQACGDCQLGRWILWRGLSIATFLYCYIMISNFPSLQPGKPGVYTRVQYYDKWIREMMGGSQAGNVLVAWIWTIPTF